MLNDKKYTENIILFLLFAASQIFNKCEKENKRGRENNIEDIEVHLAIFYMINEA